MVALIDYTILTLFHLCFCDIYDLIINNIDEYG